MSNVTKGWLQGGGQMSTTKLNIFRTINEGRRIIIYLTPSEEYQFFDVAVCPAYIRFSDESCSPFVKETAHHGEEKKEIGIFINQRQKRAYLLSDPDRGFSYLINDNKCPYGTTKFYAFIG